MKPADRQDFFVSVDEFQSFTTLALANMLSEMRKYRSSFTVAHEYLLTPDLRHAPLVTPGPRCHSWSALRTPGT
jgi:hypothetical protein